ncbi:AraC family transcriptional regulator [Mangrovibacterium diazotrophicum]|uniref:AraC-like protein n=1 Tax=Mangrovibacterium diazotrophicum TaxID=1261403 RepID=A0A419WBJ6_9BACT|nr:AraC family transcriptional regulator [Mangrovibacterium diazotrophicum]RKD92833.1 AraC-like protein [Mangrovibacterium diazotrophicum]
MENGTIYTKTTDIEHLNMNTHFHEAHHQLIYMIKGTLRVRVAETQYFLPEGFIGLVPAKVMHSLHSRNEMVKMFLIYYPSNLELNEFTLFNANDFIIENLRYLSKQEQQIDRVVHSVLFNYAYSFIALLNRSEEEHTFPVRGLIAPKNDRLAEIMQYLERNYSNPIDLNTVAKKFGFSSRNLTRLFKKENISFNNYVNYIRVVHAIEMFTDHHESVESVAYAVGYSTASNFSRTFRKYTGFSPREFINANATRAIF